ncbi:MAG TPA: FtsQ-type POTRA domain-containing protein [Candidatus Obscuribacterales bacterium]
MSLIMHVEKRREWIKSRRQQKKLARRARLRRQLLRYLCLALLLFAGACVFTRLPWWISDPTTDISVRGNIVATDEQIKAKIADVAGVPLFALDPRQLEAKVESLQSVKHAFVRRHVFPKPHISVEVLEEFPWATFSCDPDKPAEFVIAQSGRMIPISEFPNVIQPPLKVYGPPGFHISQKEVGQWASWLAYISQQTSMPTYFIDMRKPFDICVQNGDLHLKLGTADTTLSRRLGRLTSVLSAIEPLKNRLQYIDLGLDNNIPMKLAKNPPPKDGEVKKDKAAIAVSQPQM